MNDFNGFYYPLVNMYNDRISPSTVHVKNVGLSRFFKRYLLQEAMSVFEWQMPETWDRNYFLYVLYIWGYIAIINTDKFLVIPQHCTLGGINVYYGPLWATITNPLFDKTYQPIIWEDCALLRLEPDYHGIYDLVDYYGDMMALAAEAAGVNLLNSKLSFAFGAKNKAMAESMKKLYDNFASGEPAVFADAALLDDQGNLMVEMFNQNVGQNFIADRLLETMRSLKCMFLTDIGVPNTNLYKASGVNAAEVSANNIETRSKCELWLDELQEGCRKANEMFPDINLSVKWRDDIENIMKGGVIDERMDKRGGDL